MSAVRFKFNPCGESFVINAQLLPVQIDQTMLEDKNFPLIDSTRGKTASICEVAKQQKDQLQDVLGLLQLIWTLEHERENFKSREKESRKKFSENISFSFEETVPTKCVTCWDSRG